MKIKKATLFFIICITMFLNSVCFAQISEQNLQIGGIYYKQSMNDILNNYGDSIRSVSTPPVGKAYVFIVDGSEIIITPKEGLVIGLAIEGNSKLLTSLGVGLNSSLDDIIKIYGEFDEAKSIAKYKNTEIYKFSYYTPKRVYFKDVPDSPLFKGELSFLVDNTGKIYKIIISENFDYNDVSIP